MAWLKIEDGKIDVRGGPKGPLPSLEEIQAAVGGYIEAVTLTHLEQGRKVVAYYNEDGKYKRLKPNVYYWPVRDWIRGPVVVVLVDEDGQTEDMTAEEVRRLSIVDGAIAWDGINGGTRSIGGIVPPLPDHMEH